MRAFYSQAFWIATMKHTLAWLLIGSAVLLTACGQKGALHLPTDSTPAIDSTPSIDTDSDATITNPDDY